MPGAYSAIAKQAIDRGQLLAITRRAEIYEADGVTPWTTSAADRLVSGSVNLSYGDNERRTADLTLLNKDNALRSSPDGFWYDKIIKMYRGIKFDTNVVPPRAAVIEMEGGVSQSGGIISRLAQIGLPNAVYIEATSVGQLLDYDVIVSFKQSTATQKSGLLKDLYALGKSIITISKLNRTAEVPHIGTTTSITGIWGISQMSPPSSLGTGWTSEAVGASQVGYAPTTLLNGASAVARYTVGATSNVITASIVSNGTGGKWADFHLPELGGGQTAQLMANVVKWIKQSYGTYEVQLGEFVIDAIAGDNFPSNISVTMRDYVKKCLNSKLESPVIFDSGTTIETLVRALGANSGITKMRLSSMPEALGSSMAFDRGTPRWDVMRQAAQTQGYEIFFDNQGYLTTRKYLDPTSSPENYFFGTGAQGNLAKIGRRTNDSRIYNHIVVYGDPTSSESRMPYVAQALNENPSSPTRIARLGDRYYSYASSFFTSQGQCQEYADRLLGLHSLESFELDFEAINYPWIEVGEIARIADPKATETDPTKYLIDTATISLDLGPMSFTGKRVVMV